VKHLLHALSADRKGVAAVEFALVSTLLMAMLGGIADYGLALGAKSRLATAVAQGAQYAFLVGTGVTSSQIQTMVQTSSTLVGVIASTPKAPGFYCLTGAPLALTASTDGAACVDGTLAGYYVQITATYNYQAILPGFSTMAVSTALTESATVRIK
jgi:Flp pilus assembly protein TadG